MKISYSTAMLVMALSLLTGCETADTKEESAAQTGEGNVVQTVDPAPVIAEAKAAYEEVNKLGYAWRDTEEMIGEAEKAAQTNDSDSALKLAREALEQSKLAKMQYEKQQGAGPRS